MLRVYPEVRLHIKKEMFKLSTRAVPISGSGGWETEIVLGFKKSSLEIKRIERLYMEAVKKVDAVWSRLYPQFLDEFQKHQQAALWSPNPDMPGMLLVYNYEEFSYSGYEDVNRNISFDWCQPGPNTYNNTYPERFLKPVGEVNTDLARRYIAFLKYRDSLLARWRHLAALFKAWTEDDIRSKYTPPYKVGYRRTVVYNINGRAYIFKVQDANKVWLDITEVISGLDQVEMFTL